MLPGFMPILFIFYSGTGVGSRAVVVYAVFGIITGVDFG